MHQLMTPVSMRSEKSQLKLREVEYLPRVSHTANKGHSWAVNPGSLTLERVILITTVAN